MGRKRIALSLHPVATHVLVVLAGTLEISIPPLGIRVASAVTGAELACLRTESLARRPRRNPERRPALLARSRNANHDHH